MDENTRSYLEAAVEAARIGGGVLRDYARRQAPVSIDLKGLNDYVTEVDRTSERAIVGYLNGRFPDHSILAEESNGQAKDAAPFQWYVDPLDGTTNFIHGVPIYAVSVGLRVAGKMSVGAVYDPVRDEMFHAVAGGGSYVNGARVAQGRASGDGVSLPRPQPSEGVPAIIRDVHSRNRRRPPGGVGDPRPLLYGLRALRRVLGDVAVAVGHRRGESDRARSRRHGLRLPREGQLHEERQRRRREPPHPQLDAGDHPPHDGVAISGCRLAAPRALRL